MAITAYSHRYKRELDVYQLESLYEKDLNLRYITLQEFAKKDIECPSCNASGGYIVSEGVSSKTSKKVSQAHFAFKNPEGINSHLPYCEFYSAKTKKLIANEGKINFRNSNSPITKRIGIIASIGLENNIFSHDDMRDMRQWYLDLRENGQDLYNISPHIVELASVSFSRSRRNFNEFVLSKNTDVSMGLDIDKEVYESLYHKSTKYNLFKDYKGNRFYYDIKKKDVVKKAMNILKHDSSSLNFDRNILSDKFRLAYSLSSSIAKMDALLSKKITPSRISNSNPLMAISSLLLFVSDWDIKEALRKVEIIYDIGNVKDPNGGNIISFNPFANYSSWIIIKKLTLMKEAFGDSVNYDELFIEEKARLMKIYGLN